MDLKKGKPVTLTCAFLQQSSASQVQAGTEKRGRFTHDGFCQAGLTEGEQEKEVEGSGNTQ